MKKVLSIGIVTLFVFALLLAVVPKNVMAYSSPWSTGTPVPIDLTANPISTDWQLVSDGGVKLAAPATLCIPFRDKQFGWTGAIFELVSGKWKRLETKGSWVPSEEGQYTVCAAAPEAGTYALFAGLTNPPVAATCNINTKDWYVDYFYAGEYPELYPGDDNYYLDAYVPGVPVGTHVTYTILESDSHLSVANSGSTNSYLYDGEEMWADFVNDPMNWTGPWTIKVKVSAQGCSITQTLSGGGD
jgi:hypothetical protein